MGCPPLGTGSVGFDQSVQGASQVLAAEHVAVGSSQYSSMPQVAPIATFASHVHVLSVRRQVLPSPHGSSASKMRKPAAQAVPTTEDRQVPETQVPR